MLLRTEHYLNLILAQCKIVKKSPESYNLHRNYQRQVLPILKVLLTVSAGTLCLTEGQVVTAAGVVASGHKKILAAVVTAAWRVARHQAPVKILVEKVGEVGELGFLRQDDLVVLGRRAMGTNLI